MVAFLAWALWLAGLAAVLVALWRCRRRRDAHGWLLLSWGCLCLSLLLGH